MRRFELIDGVWVDIETGEPFPGVVPRDLGVGDMFGNRVVVKRLVRKGFIQIVAEEVPDDAEAGV